MSKNELKLNIGPEMKHIRDLDDYAIEVAVRGRKYAKFGVQTFIVKEGHWIEKCLEMFNIPRNKHVRNFTTKLPINKDS